MPDRGKAGVVPQDPSLAAPSAQVLSIVEQRLRGAGLMITLTLCCPVRQLVAILEDDRTATLNR